MEITRRNLFKLGTILGGGLALPAFAKERLLKPAEDLPPPRGEETTATGVCGMCPAGCGIRVRLVDGRAVGISGAADHPVNLGGMCPQGMASLQDAYHPDRIKAPLARIGHRGSGKWKEISWPDAVRKVAEELSAARRRASPFLALSPSVRDAHQEILKELAAAHSGKLLGIGYAPSEPPYDAFKSMQGSEGVYWNPSGLKLLVSFGQDWLQTHPSPVETQRLFARLRGGSNGARTRLVQAESRYSVTAAKADEWLPLRPGTEGVLALAVLRQLIADGAEDRAFVGSHADGFETLKAALKPFSPERAATLTGAPEKQVRSLASQFAALRPAAAITWRGPALTQLAVHAINAVLGNIGPGKTFSSGAAPAALPGAAAPAGTAPGVLLADRVNPLFTAPIPWRPVFQGADFIVAVHSYMTETALEADLILPCHSPLEGARLSFHSTLAGEGVLNAAPRCVEPLHDTKEPGEIFSALLAATGKGGVSDFGSYLKKRLSELHAEGLIDDKSEVRWRKTAAPAGRRFATPSGRFSFQPLVGALAGFQAPAIEDSEFPLYLHLFTPLAFFGAQGAHLPYLQSLAGVQAQEMWETWAEINPETAAKYKIADGDKVWIASRRGKLPAKARVVAWAAPEVVSVPLGLGHAAYGRWAQSAGANPMNIADGQTTRVGLSKA